MFGSYYEADYYRNPVPYRQSDIGEPVPGWGVNPLVAGPARLGVGAPPMLDTSLIRASSAQMQTPILQMQQQRGGTTTTEGGVAPGAGAPMALPWWTYPAAAAVALGLVGFYGTKKGWF